MLNAMPMAVTVICFALSLLSVASCSLLLASAAQRGPMTNKGMHIARDTAGLCVFLLWSIFLGLAIGDLTFDPVTTLVLRYAILLYPVLCVFLALTEHEWILMVPGFFTVLTIPFFETAFGTMFPFVLLGMLLVLQAESLIRLIQNIREAVWNLDVRSIQEAVDTLDDGLLFADESGRILLSNRTMYALSTSLCRQELVDGNAFWTGLKDSPATEFITKVIQENNILFRFTGGNTWTLHREELLIRDKKYVQIVALNITNSDHIQSQILARRAEVGKTAEQLQQVKEAIARQQNEEAKVARGHEIFESITGKMASLNRFFTEHYALPADTFDYKKLAVLTAGLIQDLEHAPAMTNTQKLDLTIYAFTLLSIQISVQGTLPEHEQSADALVGVIREAAVNAVIHGNATTIDVVLAEDDAGSRCTITNNGLPLNGALTPGNGILGIRRTLFPLNGQLEIIKEPVFSISVKIPKNMQ